MKTFFLMDENGVPKPTDHVTWEQEHFGTSRRFIKSTEFGKCRVSTVFLGIGHCGPGPEMDFFFETMVFGAEDLSAKLANYTGDRSIVGQFLGKDEFQRRYRTLEEAKEGHDEIVSIIKNVLASL